MDNLRGLFGTRRIDIINAWVRELRGKRKGVDEGINELFLVVWTY